MTDKLTEWERKGRAEVAFTDAAISTLDLSKATPSQREAVKAIVRRAANAALVGIGAEKEVKRLDVEDMGWATQLVIEIGRVGDEGTLNEVFSRARGQFFIGRRGGVKWFEGADRKRGLRNIRSAAFRS